MEAHRYGLSAAALKYLAALFMLVDHIGMVFPTMLTELGLPTWGGWAAPAHRAAGLSHFRLLRGRGCRRTRFFHRYLIRLGACALLSQAPFTLATGVWGGSVLLTFFLSAGAIYGYERLSKAEHGPAVSAIPLFAACALALLLNVDYGFPAVLLIFALYLCGDNRRRKLLCLGSRSGSPLSALPAPDRAALPPTVPAGLDGGLSAPCPPCVCSLRIVRRGIPPSVGLVPWAIGCAEQVVLLCVLSRAPAGPMGPGAGAELRCKQ